MFYFLFGWMIGTERKTARNAALPDSVKQERYDAAIARKAAQQLSTRKPGDPLIGKAAGRLIWAMIAVATIAVAVILLTH